MIELILKRFYLLSFLFLNCFTLNLAELKSNQNRNEMSKMSETMLNDIESAFKGITNTTDTVIRAQIIPKMYNLTYKSTFRFKVPNNESGTGYTMISMDRSEMMKPIFPNLTSDGHKVMMQGYQAAVRNVDNVYPKETINNDDLWSDLGLEGWTGDIADSTESFASRNKDKIPYYPADKILMDFEPDKYSTSKEQVKTMKPPISTNKPFSNISAAMDTTDISENIYIARANDPFGYSTKWEFRNKSNDNLNTVDRQKRDLVELYSMIKCATGCQPLNYQSYGCFCGFLGNGVAVDAIDSCCRMHDKCYEQSNCVSYLQYFVPYVWKCYRRKPLCAIDHGEFGGPTSCAALLCYCDMRLSLCLRQFFCPKRKAVCTTSLGRKLQNLFF